jgi:hypothetical protein
VVTAQWAPGCDGPGGSRAPKPPPRGSSSGGGCHRGGGSRWAWAR